MQALQEARRVAAVGIDSADKLPCKPQRIKLDEPHLL